MTLKRRPCNPRIRHSRMGAWIREGKIIEEPLSNRDRVKQNRRWDVHRYGVFDSSWDSSREFAFRQGNRKYLLECFEEERLVRLLTLPGVNARGFFNLRADLL